LTLLTPEEMMEMIRHGERATWPKIEAIRSCTKIGRILEDMLDDYEQRELSAALVGMKYGSHPRRRSLAGK
jgi:TAG lipase/steryl ester hydrolase/phospholipase A2/LPA acyltransferase